MQVNIQFNMEATKLSPEDKAYVDSIYTTITAFVDFSIPTKETTWTEGVYNEKREWVRDEVRKVIGMDYSEWNDIPEEHLKMINYSNWTQVAYVRGRRFGLTHNQAMYYMIKQNPIHTPTHRERTQSEYEKGWQQARLKK